MLRVFFICFYQTVKVFRYGLKITVLYFAGTFCILAALQCEMMVKVTKFVEDSCIVEQYEYFVHCVI